MTSPPERPPDPPPRFPCPWCGGPLRPWEDWELAVYHVPTPAWNVPTCNRCRKTTKAKN